MDNINMFRLPLKIIGLILLGRLLTYTSVGEVLREDNHSKNEQTVLSFEYDHKAVPQLISIQALVPQKKVLEVSRKEDIQLSQVESKSIEQGCFDNVVEIETQKNTNFPRKLFK